MMLSELGEMPCCEICAGWFHFCCMQFKENVNLLEKKDLVCCFCLASRTLSLISEVESVKKEVKELREKLWTEENAIPPSEKSKHTPKKQNHMLSEREKEALIYIASYHIGVSSSWRKLYQP